MREILLASYAAIGVSGLVLAALLLPLWVRKSVAYYRSTPMYRKDRRS